MMYVNESTLSSTSTQSRSGVLSRGSFLRQIPHSQRRLLCQQLDADDGWKKIVGLIPETRYSDKPRYNDLHVRLFEKELQRRDGSPADALLRDWQTQMPTIGDLLAVLQRGILSDSVNYVKGAILREAIDQEEPRLSCSRFEFSNVTDPFSIQGNLASRGFLASISTHLKQFPYSDLERFTSFFDEKPLENGGRLLGKGSYGEVFLGSMKTSDSTELIAVKRFSSSTEIYKQQFCKELEYVVKNFSHPNLLQVKGVCEDGHFCVVYEYMSERSLDKLLERVRTESKEANNLSVNRRISIAIDVASGLKFLHEQTPPIVHRDIKSANILINSDFQAKIGDFGLARVQEKNESGSFTNVTKVIHGTQAYIPPEGFISNKVSPKWDVYSFGVVLLEILFAKGPFYKDSEGIEHKMMEYIFDEDDREVEPEALIDPSCNWPVAIADDLLELARTCGLKDRIRPNMNQVLQKLVDIRKNVSTLL